MARPSGRRDLGIAAAAFAVTLTLVAGALGVTAYHSVSAAFGLVVGLIVLVEGVLVALVASEVTRRAARKANRREHRRRACLPPLPQEWEVPDYPPSDLTS